MAKLYFYYSSMNAGKSTTLLQSSYNYHERGMQTLLFTPAFAARDGAGKITSRIGLAADAIPFDEAFDLYAYVAEQMKTKPELKCIFIDEAQFLTKAQVQQISDIPDWLGLPVLAYGIRTDFRGEPFPGSLYLLAWSDEIHEIKTICHCGSKATMVLRMDDKGHIVKEGEQIEIGGNERYVAVCRKHFKLNDIGEQNDE